MKNTPWIKLWLAINILLLLFVAYSLFGPEEPTNVARVITVAVYLSNLLFGTYSLGMFRKGVFKNEKY
mgnify:CR=1 FL=1